MTIPSSILQWPSGQEASVSPDQGPVILLSGVFLVMGGAGEQEECQQGALFLKYGTSEVYLLDVFGIHHL